MDVPSLTDFVQLPDCEDQSHSGHLGTRLNPRGSQAGPLSHTLRVHTWSQDTMVQGWCSNPTTCSHLQDTQL